MPTTQHLRGRGKKVTSEKQASLYNEVQGV